MAHQMWIWSMSKYIEHICYCWMNAVFRLLLLLKQLKLFSNSRSYDVFALRILPKQNDSFYLTHKIKVKTICMPLLLTFFSAQKWNKKRVVSRSHELGLNHIPLINGLFTIWICDKIKFQSMPMRWTSGKLCKNVSSEMNCS